MKSRSNCKTPTRQLASHVDKLNRLTRLYLDLGLRSQDALQAADADLKQMPFSLFNQANGGSLASAGQQGLTTVLLVVSGIIHLLSDSVHTLPKYFTYITYK